MSDLLGTGIESAFLGVILAVPVIAALTALAALDHLPGRVQPIGAALVGLGYLSAAYLAQASFKESVTALTGPRVHAARPGDRARPGAAGARWVVPVFAAPLRRPERLLGAGDRLVHRDRGGRAPGDDGRRAHPSRPPGSLAGVGGGARGAGAVDSGLRAAHVVLQAGPGRFAFSASEGGRGASAGGNLFGPLSFFEALGVWPNADFRFEPAVTAGAWAWASRWRPPSIGVARTACGGSGCCWPRPRRPWSSTCWSRSVSIPYNAAKALVIAAPLIMLVTVAGLLIPPRRPVPPACARGAGRVLRRRLRGLVHAGAARRQRAPRHPGGGVRQFARRSAGGRLSFSGGTTTPPGSCDQPDRLSRRRRASGLQVRGLAPGGRRRRARASTRSPTRSWTWRTCSWPRTRCTRPCRVRSSAKCFATAGTACCGATRASPAALTCWGGLDEPGATLKCSTPAGRGRCARGAARSCARRPCSGPSVPGRSQPGAARPPTRAVALAGNRETIRQTNPAAPRPMGDLAELGQLDPDQRARSAGPRRSLPPYYRRRRPPLARGERARRACRRDGRRARWRAPPRRAPGRADRRRSPPCARTCRAASSPSGGRAGATWTGSSAEPIRPRHMRTCVRMRWDAQRVGSEERHELPGYRDPALVRTFDAPEALDTRFYEVRAKSALNRVPERSRMPFRWTVNPYQGMHPCLHLLHAWRYTGPDGRRLRPSRSAELERRRRDLRNRRARRLPPLRADARCCNIGPRSEPAYRVMLAGRNRAGDEREPQVPHRARLEARLRDRCTGRWQRPTPDDRERSCRGTGRFAAAPGRSPEYRRGYLCGMIRGDGTSVTTPRSRRSGGTYDAYTRFRLALTDFEAPAIDLGRSWSSRASELVDEFCGGDCESPRGAGDRRLRPT